MDIHEAARRVGALAWTEDRLFEVVGGWVASTSEPEAKLLFARSSRHHGDHALTLAAVLPETRDHDPSQLVTPGDEDGTARLDAAATTSARGDRQAARGSFHDGSAVTSNSLPAPAKG
jgi:hypothetical protein